ncbi:zinc ribbon domain-containing protein [Clostridium sp. 19966]|uniref:zinc ribbon domain-containing protein n=1 Tax=Clostridium sp. 19966 TaxID=2768166 RepID=UPI0028DF304A|nr:zinc ribbon domain-containing protein [Clostridium sp. 19966]MDT8716123.1 zinc ribbon domain-containing protein [Clostridium sp. 19966]
MYCKKCGTQVEEGRNFCPNCGSPINSNPSVNDEEAKSPDDVNIQKNVSSKPKSGKLPMIIGIVAVLVLAVFVGGFALKDLFIKKDPASRTLGAFTKISSADAVDSTTELKLKVQGASDENVMVKDILEGMSIKLTTKAKKKTNEMSMNLALLYKNSTIVDMNMYADKDQFIISSKDLLDKPVYASYKDLQKLSSENSSASSFDVSKYENLFNLKDDKDYKKLSESYADFFQKTLKDYVKETGKADVKVNEGSKAETINCNEITLDMNSQFIKQFVTQLLTKVSTDSDLKAFANKEFSKFYDEAQKNGDLDKIEKGKDEIKAAKDNFSSQWDEAMTQIKSNLSDIENQLSSLNFKATAKLRLDNKDRLRELYFETGLGDILNKVTSSTSETKASLIVDTVYNSYDNVDISKPSTSGGINLAAADEEELQSMGEDITQKLESIIASKLGVQ